MTVVDDVFGDYAPIQPGRVTAAVDDPVADEYSERDVKGLIGQIGTITSIIIILVVNAATIHFGATWKNFGENRRHRLVLIAMNCVITMFVLTYTFYRHFESK